MTSITSKTEISSLQQPGYNVNEAASQSMKPSLTNAQGGTQQVDRPSLNTCIKDF